jgi:hypothetical protein
MGSSVPSSNWAKLKEKLPSKPVATQAFLKKRKRRMSQDYEKPNPALLLNALEPEASTSASAQEWVAPCCVKRRG